MHWCSQLPDCQGINCQYRYRLGPLCISHIHSAHFGRVRQAVKVPLGLPPTGSTKRNTGLNGRV